MATGDKYVSVDAEIEWTPDGSTTPVAIGVYGRNFSWKRSAKDIDAGGYGDNTVVHLVGKLDVSAQLDMMYDDNHEIEDAIVPGAKGTLDQYPLGKTMGLRKRYMTAHIATADINEPHDNVASGTVTFLNASASGMQTTTVS